MGRSDPDFDDEVDTHISMLTERLVRRGMSLEDAGCEARRLAILWGNVKRAGSSAAAPPIRTILTGVTKLDRSRLWLPLPIRGLL